MKQSHALAYLRQLSCSGLGSDIVIPEFLRALHHVIPSLRNFYAVFDEQFNVVYEIPESFIPEFVELAEIAAEVIPKFFTPENRKRIASMYSRYPIVTGHNEVFQDLYQSDFYNLIWRQLDHHYVLDARVMHHGRVVGALSLNRPLTSQPFNSSEQTLCSQLVPYLAHALQSHQDADLDYTDSGQSGMLIMDVKGSILYHSDKARQLLALSRYPLCSLKGNNHEDPVLANLSRLCRNLNAIFQDKAAPPPCWNHTNVHGRFQFRAYWLNRHNQEPGGLIGMTVEHQEPLKLKILRGLQPLPLSPVQKEVAALLAEGLSSEAIGQRLHIKLTTVKDHIRKIFVKLDIHRREELLPILAGGNAISPLGGIPITYH